MKHTAKSDLTMGAALLGVFTLWTILIRHADVQAVGPNGSKVGFAVFNVWFHRITGEHLLIYTITDWLGLVPIIICICFGVLGLKQWIKRKNMLRVDPDILTLGVYYILVIFGYLFFEMVPINYRPVLINGILEASYPSSTTLLVLSVMPTLMFQVNRRIENPSVRKITKAFGILFSAFMVIGRLTAGVHWATDIAGSVLLSSGLYLLYRSAVKYSDEKASAGK